ncbi:hypothetical protein Cadr_000020036 [Camelus dromedarius]|uniref:Uncharacterized protein n=1 Tax=Camelus dromedarius TaxID=9838 RepID=A0A5N4D0X5_CAMDR|nr:hypothetical protein Cadr_000020036 [Camelus dromedarius]
MLETVFPSVANAAAAAAAAAAAEASTAAAAAAASMETDADATGATKALGSPLRGRCSAQAATAKGTAPLPVQPPPLAVGRRDSATQKSPGPQGSTASCLQPACLQPACLPA